MKSSYRDTCSATAISLLYIGLLKLADKFFGLSSVGLEFLLTQRYLLLSIVIIFLIFKKDKSFGILMFVIWFILNIGFVVAMLGNISGYLFPLILVVSGGLLFIISKYIK